MIPNPTNQLNYISSLLYLYIFIYSLGLSPVEYLLHILRVTPRYRSREQTAIRTKTEKLLELILSYWCKKWRIVCMGSVHMVSLPVAKVPLSSPFII